MNNRASKILLLLLETGLEQSVKNLSGRYDVSERTIYNDLEEIEEFLVQNNYHNFRREGGEYFVDIAKIEEDKLQILIETIKLQISEGKQYSPSTRVNYSIFLILSSEITITKDLADSLDLSISTIKNDLNVINNKILPFNLNLVTERFKGISIVGDEADKRDLLIEIILSDYEVSKFEEIDFFYLKYIDRKILADAKTIVDYVADSLSIQYVDKHYIFVLLSTFISLKRLIEGKRIRKMNYANLSMVTHDSFFKVVKDCMLSILKKYNSIHLPKTTLDFEVSYIVSKIQAASYHGIGDAVYDNWLNLQFIVNRFIKNIENSTNMIDSNDNQLYQEIIQHLRPALKRLEKNIFFENPLKAEIYERYPELTVIVKENISIIEHFYNINFTDDELSYMVLLFASSYERNKQRLNIKPSVVIVCKEGISTSSILKSQLERNFDINILGTYSKSKFLEDMSSLGEIEFDFVISTVPLELDKSFYLMVNPILNEKDMLQLNTFFNFYKPDKSVEQVINKIKPYVQIIDKENLKRVLVEVIGVGNETKEKNNRGVLMLEDVINDNLIVTQKRADDAFEAVEFAGDLLKENGLINDNYISAMKQNMRENGPYFVIAPGIAMPHARPEDGAKGVGISIVTLEKPVNFGHPKNDPVNLIIGLCAIDHQTHLNALAELMEILSDDKKLNAIVNSKSKKEILEILQGE